MDLLWDFLNWYEKSAVYIALKRCGAIDWALIFLILMGMAYGNRKGISDMFGKFFELLIVSLVVLTFYPVLSEILTDAVTSFPTNVANPLVFVFLTVFIWVGMAWAFNLIGKFFMIEVKGFIQPLGGVLFGAAYGIVFLSLVSQFLLFLPIEGVQKQFRTGYSYTGKYLGEIAPTLQKTLAAPFKKASKL